MQADLPLPMTFRMPPLSLVTLTGFALIDQAPRRFLPVRRRLSFVPRSIGDEELAAFRTLELTGPSPHVVERHAIHRYPRLPWDESSRRSDVAGNQNQFFWLFQSSGSR